MDTDCKYTYMYNCSYMYVLLHIYVFIQAINMKGKFFYYIDPLGPTKSIRGTYTAIKYVNIFVTYIAVMTLHAYCIQEILWYSPESYWERSCWHRQIQASATAMKSAERWLQLWCLVLEGTYVCMLLYMHVYMTLL